MKKTFTILLSILSVILISCSANNTGKLSIKQSANAVDTSDATNDFYDNTEAFPLKIPAITVEGEIANPGSVDLAKLPVHEVIVKETLLDSTGNDKFVGAYRYDGYSLFDILNQAVLKKANAKEFNPIIDLYVEVVNDKGDKVVFSWGEIYYPYNLHRIIIANSVSRIVPSKTKDLWPLPSTSKIIAATDLVTERNISNPVKIIVRSIPRSFNVTRGLSLVYSENFAVYNGEEKIAVNPPLEKFNPVTYNTVFYGRGKGIHSTSPFKGYMLKDVLGMYYKVDRPNLKTGIVCLAAFDGYRCAVSFSELFNRNDQQEFLLIKTREKEDGGLFRVFAGPDFFSDRAVKALNGVYLMN